MEQSSFHFFVPQYRKCVYVCVCSLSPTWVNLQSYRIAVLLWIYFGGFHMNRDKSAIGMDKTCKKHTFVLISFIKMSLDTYILTSIATCGCNLENFAILNPLFRFVSFATRVYSACVFVLPSVAFKAHHLDFCQIKMQNDETTILNGDLMAGNGNRFSSTLFICATDTDSTVENVSLFFCRKQSVMPTCFAKIQAKKYSNTELANGNWLVPSNSVLMIIFFEITLWSKVSTIFCFKLSFRSIFFINIYQWLNESEMLIKTQWKF